MLDTLGVFVASNLGCSKWAQTHPDGGVSAVLLLHSACFPIKLKISHEVEGFHCTKCRPFDLENSKK